MTDKKTRTCHACDSHAPTAETVSMWGFQAEHPLWAFVDEENIRKIKRRFLFSNYSEAVKFTGQIAALAAYEDHHPAILLEWDTVTVTWCTKSIGGLHNNDLIMAQQTDKLFDVSQRRAERAV